MRFNCDRLDDYLRDCKRRRDEARREWHVWFAWRPVKLEHGDCRWFEFVERREVYVNGYFESYYEWEYRAKNA